MTSSANSLRLASLSSQDIGPTLNCRIRPPIPISCSRSIRFATVSGEPNIMLFSTLNLGSASPVLTDAISSAVFSFSRVSSMCRLPATCTCVASRSASVSFSATYILRQIHEFSIAHFTCASSYPLSRMESWYTLNRLSVSSSGWTTSIRGRPCLPISTIEPSVATARIIGGCGLWYTFGLSTGSSMSKYSPL